MPLDYLEQSKISALPFPEQASGYSPLRPCRRCLLPDKVSNWSRSAAYIFTPPVLPPSLLVLHRFPDFAASLRFLSDLTSTMRNPQVFALSEKDTEFLPPFVQYIVICQWSVQLQTLPKLCLCLLYMNVTEARTSWKGAGRTGCPYVNCGRGFTLVNLGVVKRMTPRLAHPFLISKHSIVNIE